MRVDKSNADVSQDVVCDKPTPVQDLVRERVAKALFAIGYPGGWKWDNASPGTKSWSYHQADAAISALYAALQEIELPPDMSADIIDNRSNQGVTIPRETLTKLFRAIIKSLASLHKDKGERV